MKEFLCRKTVLIFILTLHFTAVIGQGNLVNFNTIPKSGTILVYSHLDDDLIWMLPFWKITEKFIGGAMPSTPSYNKIIHEQQTYLDAHGYNIDYESNWTSAWTDITDQEYTEYYLMNNPSYSYLVLDHLETRMYNDPNEMSTFELNKLKAKIEQYIASPDVSRIITHNIWGEYGHKHHKAVNKAVRELAVKYRKDVWMLGCDNERFEDYYPIPDGITYTMGSFDDPTLYTSIRNIYEINNRWTWYLDRTPSGDHAFIKIVEAGVDKSDLIIDESVTSSGPVQNLPGAYIFDGNDDYMTLTGNNNPSFTIAMRVRPDQIRSMDISKMTEYPSNSNSDRNFYLNSDGRVSARIFDGSTKVVTSTSALTAGSWSHIVMTSNGSSLKIYVNGNLENTISAGNASTGYSTPEFVLGQTAQTSSYFSGQITDVRLINYAMTDNEVATLSGVVYTIISSSNTGGNINPNGAATVNVGANKTYTITSNTGYYISDVKVDNNSVGAVTTYTFNHVITDHTITATFAPVTFLITATAGTGGTISPLGEVTVNSGTNRVFTITPNSGFKITDVKVDDISQGSISSYTFSNISSNHTISATFAPLVTYTISSAAGSGGSINPLGTLTVGGGTNQTFTFTPDIGYRIDEVTVDGIPAGALETYTFNNIAANHTISVTFTLTPTYTITSSTNAGGSINPAGTVLVNEGSDQTFSISPNAGFRISEVSVDNNPLGALTTYTFNNINSNHTISATFAAIPTYSVTTSSGSGGSIDPAGTITVYEGSDQSFHFSPNTGYQISDVKVDNTSLGILSNYTFNNITSNHTIHADFTPLTYTISSSAATGGSISPSGVRTVNYGTNQTYNISCNQGYQISDVRVDNISVGAISTYTFNNVKANHSISVTFSIITYEILSNSGTGGSISPSGSLIVNYGSNQTFTISPNMGFRISDILVDNISRGIISTYTFNNITADHTISAVFTPITFTISSNAEANGSINPEGIVTLNYGANRVFSITPDYGYQVSDVEVDNVSMGAVSSYTFSNVLANHTITAKFEVAKYTIEGSAGEGGSIAPSGILTIEHGNNQSYTITPDTGFRIADVEVDDNSIGSGSTYTFNNVTNDHTISATFSVITYTITGTSGENGSITPNGDVTVDYGSNLSFTITPNTGYKISDVLIGNVSIGITSTFTFNDIHSDNSISATFTPITYNITANSGNGGSITPSGIRTTNYGTNQTYTVTPNVGYHISDVKVDDRSVGAVSSFTFSDITANHTIAASFAINTYTILSNAGTGGQISPSGLTTLDFGTNQVCRIIPDPGYQISDVRVDNISVGPISTYTFNNISANHTISASFSIITYTITGSAGTGGSISPAGNVTVNYGTNLSYNIIPDLGFRISEIKVDNILVESASTFTFSNITSNHTISVTFALLSYTITGDIVKEEGEKEGGSISPSGQIKVDYGTNKSFTITPDTGYYISDLIVNNISIGAQSNYTFNKITSDQTISAIFKPILYTITSNAGSGGSIFTEGTETVVYGENQTYIITPDTGYQISEVLVDSTLAGTPLSYTFNSVTSNHSISVTFTRIIFQVSGSAGPGGSISPAYTLPIYYGESQSYTITPDSTYKISDVKVDNISVGAITSYTFNYITANHIISATFVPIDTYLITASAGPGGTISPAGHNEFFEGSNPTYSITPDFGFRILNVKVDNFEKGVLSDYTFNNLLTDHTISATFTIDIDVKVYPNPFKEYFKIDIVTPREELYDISIIDISEKTVFTKTKIPGNTQTIINLRNTPPGIYILRLYCKGTRMATFRIVKY